MHSQSPTIPAPRPDRPSAVAGQPAAYFWKDVIRPGKYVHPVRGFTLDVDRPRMQRWAATGRRMIAAGINIPANADHSSSAYDALGRILDFRIEGDSLLALHQMIGSDAAKLAARNQASVGIDPDFVDGRGRRWGEAIVHVALTPVPVVPGQGPFIQAASRAPAAGNRLTRPAGDGRSIVFNIPCSSEQMSALRGLLPGGATLEPDGLFDPLIEYLRDVARSDDDDAGGSAATAELTRAQIADAARRRRDETRQAALELSTLRDQLASRDRQIAELSARVPRPLDAESQEAMVAAIAAKKQMAVARGAVTPAVADRLFAALVKSPAGRVNPLCLSRSANLFGDVALGLFVFDALADNTPVPLGESSGVQLLARSIADDPTEQRRQKLTERMIQLANGK
jgi:hypothetical protein